MPPHLVLECDTLKLVPWPHTVVVVSAALWDCVWSLGYRVNGRKAWETHV